ncbi:MAG: hypothetical protein RL846_18885 [Deltaproteobacteria bacterium]
MSAWLATLFAATGVSVVFVPDVPEHCATQARVASVVDLTDGLRLLRGPLEKDEKLDAARERLAATVAIVARRTEDGVTVEVAHADGVTKKTAPAQGGAPLAEALRAAWPKSAPPLLEARALGVPNDAAIDAACKGDAKAAYDASGAAVGRTIPALIAPDEKRRGVHSSSTGRSPAHAPPPVTADAPSRRSTARSSRWSAGPSHRCGAARRRPRRRSRPPWRSSTTSSPRSKPVRSSRWICSPGKSGGASKSAPRSPRSSARGAT